jgi:phosphoribosylformylglycinamidine synthase
VSTETVATAECESGERLSIPVKHMSGRWFAPADMLARIESRGQIVFRYGEGHNPNGSVADVAGVSNERGNVVGLMPHPEHAVDPLTGSADGLALFESIAAAALPVAA